jgi:hypothetical protein
VLFQFLPDLAIGGPTNAKAAVLHALIPTEGTEPRDKDLTTVLLVGGTTYALLAQYDRGIDTRTELFFPGHEVDPSGAVPDRSYDVLHTVSASNRHAVTLRPT